MRFWRQISEWIKKSSHRWIDRLRSTAFAAAVLGGVVIASFAAWNRFTYQTGEIIVSSPQVYTRERLVNDRYDQAHWLQQQLNNLDLTNRLVTGTAQNSDNVEVMVSGPSASSPTQPSSTTGPPPRSTGSPSGEAPAAAGGPALPFDLEFVIRSSIRDTIRELALENSLDDRHDLRGNSIYGLKFDTTVLPGSSRDAALVKVTLTSGDLGDINEYVQKSSPNSPGLPQFISEYYIGFSERKKGQYSDVELSRQYRVYRLNEVYENWVRDVGQRLNQYSEKVLSRNSCACDSSVTPCIGSRQIVQQALAAVLGEKIAVPTYLFSRTQVQGAAASDFIPVYSLPVPAPLNSVLSITVSETSETTNGKECVAAIKFATSAVYEYVFSIDWESVGSDGKSGVSDDYRRKLQAEHFLDVGESEVGLYMRIPDYNLFSFGSRYGSQVSKINELVQQQGLAVRLAEVFPDLEKGKRVAAKMFSIPRGLFNFIERAADQDQYAYSLSPRSELAGYLVDNISSMSASVQAAAGAGQVGGAFKSEQALREARATPRAVGFVESSLGGGIEFGWLIESEPQAGPSQKSHLALVSVPAWAKEISLCVRTSWKSAAPSATLRGFNGTAQTDDCLPPGETLNVPVPQDMEALDAIIISGTERPPPRIFSQLMDSNPLTACAPASIVIPGERLWRNTVVTLGGQRADRIAVLPNMRGIVAEFERILPLAEPVPSTRPASGPALDKRWLQVWTTEGSDSALSQITVTSAPATAPCRPAVPETTPR